MPTMAEIFTRPDRKLRGSAAERYRESEEFQHASVVAPRHAQRTPFAQDSLTEIPADSSHNYNPIKSGNHQPQKDLKRLNRAQLQPTDSSTTPANPRQQCLDFAPQIVAPRPRASIETLKKSSTAALNRPLIGPIKPQALDRLSLPSRTLPLNELEHLSIEIWSTHSAFVTIKQQATNKSQSLCSVGFAHSHASKRIDLHAVLTSLRTQPIRRPINSVWRANGKHHTPKPRALFNPSQQKIERCWLLQARPAPAALWEHN